MIHKTLPRSRHDDNYPKVVLPGLTPDAAMALSAIILDNIQGMASTDIETFSAGLSAATQLQRLAKGESLAS